MKTEVIKKIWIVVIIFCSFDAYSEWTPDHLEREKIEFRDANFFNCNFAVDSINGSCEGESDGEIYFSLDDPLCMDYTICLLVNGNCVNSAPTMINSISYVFQGLSPGNYSIQVESGDCGCMSNFVGLFNVPTIGGAINLSIAATPDPNLTCENASVTFTATGDFTSLTWENVTTNTDLGTNPTIELTEAGEYMATAINADGCDQSQTVTVEDYRNAFPSANAGNDMELTSCNNGVTLTGSGMPGVLGSSVTYNWEGPGGTTFNEQNPSVNQPGTYTLTVTDNLSQCTMTNQVNVTSNVVFPIADAGEDGTLTCAVTAYELGGTATTTSGNMMYQWSTMDGQVNNPNIINPVISTAGTYALTVTDNDTGCSATDEITITLDNTPPELSIDPTGNIELCEGEEIDLMAISSDADMIEWRANGQANGTTGNTLTVTSAGFYSYQGTNSINGCSAISESVGVNFLPTPTLAIAEIDLAIKNGESYDFVGTFAPGDAQIIWEIENGNISNIDTSQSQLSTQGEGIPTGNLFLLNERLFGKVIFTIYPQLDDCTGEVLMISVQVLPEQDVFIPDLFTPNGDTANDRWKIIFADVEKADDYSVVIFSRSGAKVHEINGLGGDGWTGEGCPDGVYFYHLKNTDGTDEQKGAVTLLRKVE